jgi:hypothetical protein
MPPRVLAALSLVAAMALTGANVAFGQAIAAAINVHIFVLCRFAVASLALAPMARSEAGPALARMSLGEWRDLLLMAMLGLDGFTVLMLRSIWAKPSAWRGLPEPCWSSAAFSWAPSVLQLHIADGGPRSSQERCRAAARAGGHRWSAH